MKIRDRYTSKGTRRKGSGLPKFVQPSKAKGRRWFGRRAAHGQRAGCGCATAILIVGSLVPVVAHALGY